MRACLAITGTLFALLAAIHLWRMVVEWTGTAEWLGAGTGLLAAGLSVWAWRLFANAKQSA
jgi:multisubunit Na+/H+ antiporter MnhG subunit